MRVAPSDLCERGVFASRPYEAGEIIESCPYIEVPVEEVAGLIDYSYEGSDDSTVFIVFGYGMLYNHANPGNVTYHLCEDSARFVFSAITAIAEGDELTHDYGEGWWSSRDLRPARVSGQTVTPIKGWQAFEKAEIRPILALKP